MSTGHLGRTLKLSIVCLKDGLTRLLHAVIVIILVFVTPTNAELKVFHGLHKPSWSHWWSRRTRARPRRGCAAAGPRAAARASPSPVHRSRMLECWDAFVHKLHPAAVGLPPGPSFYPALGLRNMSARAAQPTWPKTRHTRPRGHGATT